MIGAVRPILVLVLTLSLCVTMLLGASVAAAQSGSQRTGNMPPAPEWMVPDFPLPRHVSLCGVSFPLQNRFVYEDLDLEFTIAVHAHAQVYLWLRRAGRYFPHIEQELAKAGLPDDIKYLAVAESDLRPHAVSPARATGTWQFMPATGTRFGLRRSNHFDDRRHFEKSTEAAIQYLKYLHDMFGDWLLAMAAYNCGEGRVAGAIKTQGVRNYFLLDLPAETERYIYRIATIKILLENPRRYGYALHTAPYPPLDLDRVQVNLNSPVHFTRAAQAIGSHYKTLKELNPEIKGEYLPVGRYQIFAPDGAGPALSRFLNQGATSRSSGSSSGETRYYVVKRGDTLARISGRTGVPVSTIRSMNGIRGDKILIGQRLRLPK